VRYSWPGTPLGHSHTHIHSFAGHTRAHVLANMYNLPASPCSRNELHNFFPRCIECRRGLAMRIMSVRSSGQPARRQSRALWQNEIKFGPDYYITWKNVYPSFGKQEEWLVGTTPSTWNFRSNWPCWSENANF